MPAKRANIAVEGTAEKLRFLVSSRRSPAAQLKRQISRMNTSAKREAALQLLSATGIWKSNYAPPGLRLLWRLGFDCPPPHLAGFWSVFFACGFYFGASMGLLLWAVASYSGYNIFPSVPLRAAIAGLGFGLFMAAYYAWGRRKHKLPLWKDLASSN
jgi:hypothetical protein